MTTPPSENQASASGPGRAFRGVILCLVAFVAAELGVRMEEWFRWRTPFSSNLQSVSDLAVRDSTGVHPVPGGRFRKWEINSVGTRGTEPVAGLPTLVIAGASETFGLYETPTREYPRQLADTLAARGCRANVLNAGFPGMSLPTVEQDLRLRLATMRPRAVLYYPTPPQYLDEVGPPTPAKPDSSGTVPLRTPRPSSRFVARAVTQVKSMLPPVADLLRRRDLRAAREGIEPDSLFTRIPEERLAVFEGDLRRLVGTIRRIGATPILATHANGFVGTPPMAPAVLRAWERFYPRATGAVLVAFDSAASARVRLVASDSTVALVDPWQAFRGVPAPEIFADFSHFTDHGAALMAGLLAPAARTSLGCR